MDSNQQAIPRVQFVSDFLSIWQETFQGSPPGQGSIYLDQEKGFMNTLQGVNSEAASRMIGGTTIAAQTEHTKFYVDRLLDYINGNQEQVNWEQSWLIETVTAAEWDILRAGLFSSYENTVKQLEAVDSWDPDNVGDVLAIVAHTAYHLGAIRQMVKSV